MGMGMLEVAMEMMRACGRCVSVVVCLALRRDGLGYVQEGQKDKPSIQRFAHNSTYIASRPQLPNVDGM